MRACSYCQRSDVEFTNPTRSHCRSCVNRANRNRKAQYSPEQREAVRQYQKEYRLRTRYGIDADMYDRMMEIQEDSCAICCIPFGSLEEPYVDHCHKSNKVRGLLCRKCNLAIGYMRDDIEIVLRVAAYLDR